MNRGIIVVVAILVLYLLVDLASLPAKLLEPGAGENEPDHVLIYQVYGRGDKTDASISHSFVELYNPTAQDVPIDGWSLQYTATGNNWKVFILEGVIPAKSSYLIRCYSNDGLASRHTITEYDADWADRRISNNGYKVALVDHGRDLPEAYPIEGDGVVDFLGVGDTDYGDGKPVASVSKQKAVRRISVMDTDDNAADFETVDYREERLEEDAFELVKPRSSADGPWDPASVKRDDKLVFSKPGGLYTAPFSLLLTTFFEKSMIRYTLDGTEPTVSSPVFSDGIMISDRTGDPERLAAVANIMEEGVVLPEAAVYKGMSIRARVYTEDGRPLSPVVTQSYFVDPEIFSKYNGLPVISLVTDSANLFDDDSGIYVYDNYRNRGPDWERPVHVEFYEGDGSLAFSQDMGMRIHGLSSREYQQKSFRLYARGSYDTVNPAVDYDLFQGRALDMDGIPITSFHDFILRNDGTGWNMGTIKDSFIQRVCAEAQGFNAATQASRQCVAFIDGEFWGVYSVRQRYDERYYADTYHLDKDRIQTAEKAAVMPVPAASGGGEAAEAAYDEMRDFFSNTPGESFSDDAVYNTAKGYVDIDNLIDVFAAYMYWGNRDWPINNYRMWRYAGPPEDGYTYTDGRWRLVLNDFDLAWTVDVNNGILVYFLTNDGSAENENIDALDMYMDLLENPEFKERLATRFCDLMNTVFTPAYVNPILDEMYNNFAPVFAEQEERYPVDPEHLWGDLASEYKDIKAYVKARPKVMRDHLRGRLSLADDAALRLETDTEMGDVELNGISLEPFISVKTSAWEGVYFAGSEQKLAAVPKEGYRFEKFVVTRPGGEDGDASASEYTDDHLSLAMPEGGCTVEAVFTR